VRIGSHKNMILIFTCFVTNKLIVIFSKIEVVTGNSCVYFILVSIERKYFTHVVFEQEAILLSV
jgi:hypothetical protein